MDKVIHYFWFGHHEKPPIVQQCIASWKKMMPDWKIVEWNEDNYDVNCIPYSKESYEAKKYAFVSDYARCKILYEKGGVYLDTDVEVLKPLDDLVENYDGFMGFELEETVAPGLIMGMNQGEPLLQDICTKYENIHFILENGQFNLKTIVEFTTEVLLQYGLIPNGKKQLIGNVTIFPREYFAPFDIYTEKLIITSNTYSVHHYTATWRPWNKKLVAAIRTFMKSILGSTITKKIIELKRKYRGRK